MTNDGMGGRRRGLLSGLQISSPITRRVFFSFHYAQDIWRVQQVRQHWITKPNRQVAGYFDGSLFEKAKTEGDNAVRRLIDANLTGCSVTCVLVGAYTYSRKWVHYEIFRSIERGMGVFAVRINSLKNMQGHVDHPGHNPFDCLGLGTDQSGSFVPYVHRGVGWEKFAPGRPIGVAAAPYLIRGTKPLLSSIFRTYDWVTQSGYDNFSTWVDAAASQAGR